MKRTVSIVVVVLALLIILPLLWMLGMMAIGTGTMGAMMDGGMGVWGFAWMLLIATLLVLLIVLLLRGATRA